MHIRSEHQEKLTKVRMKHLFDRRSKTAPSTATLPHSLSLNANPEPTVQPPPSNPNPGPTGLDIDEAIPLTALDASTLGLRQLIPNEVVDDGAGLTGTSSLIPLVDLFNFDVSHWINLYNKPAEKHFTEELELCELLNRDAATEEGAEVDVDEMTGDILTG